MSELASESRRSARAKRRAMSNEQFPGIAEQAAPLDALLVDAALGPLRRFLPDASTAKWAAALAARPRTTARRLVGLGAEAGRIVAGTSELAPRKKDRRFADNGWTDNPLLRRLVQLYLAGGATLDQLVSDAELGPRDRKRVRFLLENVVEAAAPSNLPLVNPASAKAAIDTAGLSLARGGMRLVKDLAAAPRVPEMVDTSGFALGENIAATPGSVVFRNEVLELIQYRPQCDQVYEVPVLVVPPTINKYYAIDLAPGRSLVEFSVQHNRQMFVLSWRNPDARHAAWAFDTYVRAILDALDAVEEITGSARTVLAGICSGGILAGIVAAYLAGIGRQDRLAAVWLAVTVIDNAGAGTVAALTDARLAASAKARSARTGYLDGRSLAEVFAWLRPNDLIWNYWVNNYLLGKRPPAFDILFWNADTTRMTAGLHADFVDLAMDNQLTRAGALTVLGVPIDLGAITVDSYVVAGIADHITPWENCYRTTQLFGGRSRFVLSTSGHIAALVNPPGNPKATFHTNDDHGPDAAAWLTRAETHQGSWWNDVAAWLDARCGELRPAPEELGSTRLRPLDEAPGTYVFDK
ncbi:PHA/PHB synthase family protein [Pseudonocardia sichuanensis]